MGDNLTEFNTAQNRRISMMGIPKEADNFVKKRRKIHITFNEEEEVINPEDVDPSIGRFRNMVQTTVIPRAAAKHQDSGFGLSAPSSGPDHHHHHKRLRVERDVGGERGEGGGVMGLYEPDDAESMFSTTLSSSLGLS